MKTAEEICNQRFQNKINNIIHCVENHYGYYVGTEYDYTTNKYKQSQLPEEKVLNKLKELGFKIEISKVKRNNLKEIKNVLKTKGKKFLGFKLTEDEYEHINVYEECEFELLTITACCNEVNK